MDRYRGSVEAAGINLWAQQMMAFWSSAVLGQVTNSAIEVSIGRLGSEVVGSALGTQPVMSAHAREEKETAFRRSRESENSWRSLQHLKR